MDSDESTAVFNIKRKFGQLVSSVSGSALGVPRLSFEEG